jgi:hypothetical protein
LWGIFLVDRYPQAFVVGDPEGSEFRAALLGLRGLDLDLISELPYI